MSEFLNPVKIRPIMGLKSGIQINIIIIDKLKSDL